MSSRATPPAQARSDPRTRPLVEAVAGAPHSLARIGVLAPGGYGKTVLLRELSEIYRRAGVAVVDGWGDPAGDDAGPSVVLVDDAHLLGEDRLRELRRLVQARMLGLVIAYRPWPRPPALAALLTELLRPPGATPVILHPFTERQTADYLGPGTGPALAEFIHAQTGGVPRLVDRLAAALEPPSHHVPLSKLARMGLDLDDLDRDLRTLLLAAATDVELTADLLDALLGREPAATDELLAAARATGLLGPDGTLVPIARRAVATLSPVAHRTAVWQRLAEHQRTRGGRVLPLVRSLREAGVGGAGLAELFEAAADEALAEEPALAAELFAAAAASRPTAARRALAAALAGDLDLGLRLADRLIGADPAGGAATGEPPPDRAAGAAVAAAALAHRGQLGRSAELYRWSGTASSVAFAAIGFLGTGHPDRADQAPPAGPPTLLASAAGLMASGVQATVSGPPTAALSTLVQAAALLEPAGRSVLLPDSPAALAALVALHSGELEIGESVLERAIAVKMGARLLSRRHRLLQAWIHMVRGSTGTAAERLSVAVDGDGPLEPRDLLFATALEVGIARRNSDLAGVHRGWRRAREAIIRHQVDLFALLPLGELAVAAARLGEPDRLGTHLHEAYRLLERLGDPPLWMASLRWSDLHAAILAEQPARAEQQVAALRAAAGHSRYAAAVAAAAGAWVEVMRGTVEPAAVEAAARGLHGAGLGWDAARLAGQAAIRTPDRKAMTSLLECARVLQGRPRGATATTVVIEGTDRPAAQASNGNPLSHREQEVAALMLDGLTYKQIGDRLYISAKTVEHHVARMRQRLGCASRNDLLTQLRAITADHPGGELLHRPPWPRRPAD